MIFYQDTQAIKMTTFEIIPEKHFDKFVQY